MNSSMRTAILSMVTFPAGIRDDLYTEVSSLAEKTGNYDVVEKLTFDTIKRQWYLFPSLATVLSELQPFSYVCEDDRGN